MIADMFENKCLDRAVSTMRAALGYETGLPDNWPLHPIDDREIPNAIEMIDSSFDGREILMWCTEENWDKVSKRVCNAKYQGCFASATEDSNLYLYAFTYHGDSIGHIVVGWPVAYGDMSIGMMVAVKICANESPPQKELK